ncbi:MAG: ribosome maturation factor RimM [Pseudomonadota bacterium]
MEKLSLIEVGVVVKPHGVRGAVKVRLHNSDSRGYLSEEILLELPSGEMCGEMCRLGASSGDIILSVPGIDNREQAETLRGAGLFVRKEAIALGDGEYLYSDLIGCKVFEGERSYGVVTYVFEAGASDVLVVQEGEVERMIPLVDQWIRSIDTDAKRIEVVDGEQWESVSVDNEK